MDYVIYIADIAFLICVLFWLAGLAKDINDANRRVDALHERLDVLRDFIMQKQENGLAALEKRMKEFNA